MKRTAAVLLAIAASVLGTPTARADEPMVCTDPINGTADIDCDGVGDEDEGRQQDCPDGQVGTVHSHVLVCPPPIVIVADPEPPVVEEPPVADPEPPVVEQSPVVEQPTPAPIMTVTPAPAASTAELAYTGVRDYIPALAAGGFLLIALGAVCLRLSRRRAH